MARISRKNLNKSENIESDNEKNRGEVFKVGFYARVSVSEKRTNSNSINAQISILRSFVNKKNTENKNENLESFEKFIIFAEYIDDGKTGTNFNREAFKKLQEDVKKNNVNCIIVKDLSRFGRNSLEVSDYIQNIYPFLGVRFIAINDNFDSFLENCSNFTLNFLNLANELYAKDISAKITTVIARKKKDGEFIGSFAAYGYLRNPLDKNKLIVDEYASKIVNKIFFLKKEGEGNLKIAKILNENNVKCPSKYRGQKNSENLLWNDKTIKFILSNEVYLGNLVQGRKEQALFRGQNQVVLPKEKWIVVENTHEAIIDKELFYKVRKIMFERTRAYFLVNYKNV